MRVIDLLNKIANGEKLPEIIKVMGGSYYLCEGDQSGSYYFSEKQGFGGVKFKFDTSVMNEEVEIIEEDNKIEKISNDFYQHSNDYLYNELEKKINEIIDHINKGD